MNGSARRPVIAGNWKMHKTTVEARALAHAVAAGATGFDHCDVVLAPPATALETVRQEIRNTRLRLGAQNVHWERQGAFTGEISIPMLEDLGCSAVILGHSERRQLFGETDATVNRRVRAVIPSVVEPIVCVGETLAERERGDYQAVIFQQLAGGLSGLTPRDALRMMLAYEPVWAIGTGRTATPEIAQEVHGAIRGWLRKQFGETVSEQVRILYGGSVKPDNIGPLMAEPDIDGALVGGACLEADSFLKIIGYNR
jgi:triosephosphate isomerase